jgi:Brp/Blh family beta-carotene 15,15'-monooxygenase
LSVLILVFGLPHGAYDIFLLRAQFSPGKARRVAGLYLLSALSVAGIWWAAPAVFLLMFLLVSIVHFGDSDWPDGPWSAKLGWGSLVLAIPAAVQPEEVRALFSLFAPAPVAAAFAASLAVLIVPGVALLLVHRQAFAWKLLALFLLAALCFRTSALVGFTVYFCLFHSRLHLRRWRERLPVAETRLADLLVLLVLGGVALLVVADGVFESVAELDAYLVKITFLVLASLTVPHMITVALANRFLLGRRAAHWPQYQANMKRRFRTTVSNS